MHNGEEQDVELTKKSLTRRSIFLRRQRQKLPSIRQSSWVAPLASLFLWSCLLFFSALLRKVWQLILVIRSPNNHDVAKGQIGNLNLSTRRCLLKEAFLSGELLVGSHRSNAGRNHDIMTCQEAVNELENNGIRYMDIDVTLPTDKKQNDESRSTSDLLVAHPSELKHDGTILRSPCSLVSLSDLLMILRHHDWMITIEPKASWPGSTGDYLLLSSPLEVLRTLMSVLELHGLEPHQCAVIINIDNLATVEEELLVSKMKSHCDLSYPISRKGARDLALRASEKYPKRGDYHYVMPTVELSRQHPAYIDLSKEFDVDFVRQHLHSSNILEIVWIVDTVYDLDVVCDWDTMIPFGIVSNNPLGIVDIIKGSDWCNLDHSKYS